MSRFFPSRLWSGLLSATTSIAARRQQPSDGFVLAPKITGLFDGRKRGPIRSGTTNNIAPSLWVYPDHIEYVAFYKGPRRLERSEMAEVDVRRNPVGGKLIFRRSDESFVECTFRTDQLLQETLSVLAAHDFPLTD